MARVIDGCDDEAEGEQDGDNDSSSNVGRSGDGSSDEGSTSDDDSDHRPEEGVTIAQGETCQLPRSMRLFGHRQTKGIGRMLTS